MDERIARELKKAAADTSDIRQPDFDTLMQNAGRQSRRRRVRGIASVCVCAIVAAAIAWVTIAALAREPGARPGLSESASVGNQPRSERHIKKFVVPTDTWRPGDSRMESRIVGILRFTSDDCPYLDAEGNVGYRPWLAFPSNAVGFKTDDGKRHVADPRGFLYGTEGETGDFGGGSVSRTDVKGPCGRTEASTYGFGIMNEPTEKQLDVSR